MSPELHDFLSNLKSYASFRHRRKLLWIFIGFLLFLIFKPTSYDFVGGTVPAFATLVCNDTTARQANTLIYSLKSVQTRLPIVVVALNGASKSAIRQFSVGGAIVKTAAQLQVALNKQGIHAFPESCESGLAYAWALFEYSRIIYIAPESLVLKNMDELAAKDELSARPNSLTPELFDPNLMVLQPTPQGFLNVLSELTTKAASKRHIAVSFNHIFKSWFNDAQRHIPSYYQVNGAEQYDAYARLGLGVKSVYFSENPKPWNFHREPALKSHRGEHTLYYMWQRADREARKALAAAGLPHQVVPSWRN
eukprot:Colp12_sorted_trinity150504_noHs@1477